MARKVAGWMGIGAALWGAFGMGAAPQQGRENYEVGGQPIELSKIWNAPLTISLPKAKVNFSARTERDQPEDTVDALLIALSFKSPEQLKK